MMSSATLNSLSASLVPPSVAAPMPSTNGPIRELNILLLGESGTGKSTFINALANYLLYNTLDEAIRGKVEVIIPASFSITNSDTYETRTVYVGEPDPNENNDEIGESRTRGCKTYVFSITNFKLRIIDAPGVGDTRGIDQNAKNFEHILAYISHYTHLDGICTLLKPNEERLDVRFRYCVKELLSQLHKSAKDNIMFIFTHARATFFKPGATTPLLKKLLEELRDKSGIDVPFTRDNTFFFDNESFRFLALHHNDIQSPPGDTQAFRASWDTSILEYGKLIDRIARCERHLIRDTLSLNEARQLIGKLHRPIAEIACLIQENIQLAEEYKRERFINGTATIDDELSNAVSVPQYSAEIIYLPYPRTVCTSESCTELVLIEGRSEIDYVSHCHEHCYLKGVEQEVIRNPALKKCAAMDRVSGLCHNCDCSWDTHQHITYEYRMHLSSIEIPLNMSSPSNILSRSSSFSSAISSLPVSPVSRHVSQAESAVNQLIDDLRKEETMILTECGKLSRFLRANAITPYNDDTIEYIRYHIGVEERKQGAGAQNSEVIRGLQASLDSFEQEMELFEKAYTAGNGSITAADSTNRIPQLEEIFPLIERLYALPLNGDKIRQQVEGLRASQYANVQRREEIIPLPSTGTSSIIATILSQPAP